MSSVGGEIKKTRHVAGEEEKMEKILRDSSGAAVAVPEQTIEHLQAHPEVGSVLEEAVSVVRFPRGEFARLEARLGRVIGHDSLVADTESCLFALRKGREKASRVSLKRAPESKKVSLVAYWDEERELHVLIAAWVGILAPREPWDPNISSRREFQESLNFWSSHALMWDPEVMGPTFESSWTLVLGPEPAVWELEELMVSRKTD